VLWSFLEKFCFIDEKSVIFVESDDLILSKMEFPSERILDVFFCFIAYFQSS